MYFSNGTAMNVKTLQKSPKFGLAGCQRNGTLASKSHAILRTTKPVIALPPQIAFAQIYAVPRRCLTQLTTNMRQEPTSV